MLPSHTNRAALLRACLTHRLPHFKQPPFGTCASVVLVSAPRLEPQTESITLHQQGILATRVLQIGTCGLSPLEQCAARSRRLAWRRRRRVPACSGAGPGWGAQTPPPPRPPGPPPSWRVLLRLRGTTPVCCAGSPGGEEGAVAGTRAVPGRAVRWGRGCPTRRRGRLGRARAGGPRRRAGPAVKGKRSTVRRWKAGGEREGLPTKTPDRQSSATRRGCRERALC